MAFRYRPDAPRVTATFERRTATRPDPARPARLARRLVAATVAVLTGVATALLGAPVPASAAVGTQLASRLTSPAGFVQLGGSVWVSDHNSGFCRIDAGRITVSTCSAAAVSPGQASTDGTNVYLPNNAGRGDGLVRLTFDPATNTVGSPVVIPGIDAASKPTSSALVGGALYVGFLKSGAIVRVAAPASTAAVQPAASTSDGGGAAALAGSGGDLYVAEGVGVTKVANIGGQSTAVAAPTPVTVVASALTSNNAGVLYLGVGTAVLRYTIATNTQDTFALGTATANFQPITGLGLGTSLFAGDDATDGGFAGTGFGYTIDPAAGPVLAGTPGLPAPIPAPVGPRPSTLIATDLTAPGGVVSLGTGADRTLWESDHDQGFCRVDPAPASPGGNTITLSTCSRAATSPGAAVFDPDSNAVYLSDNATKNNGVTRLTYNPATHTVGSPVTIAPPGVAPKFSNALALGPDGSLYVGYIRDGAIDRITTPLGATSQVQPVGNSSSRGGVTGIAFVGNTLYLSETGGITAMANAATCSACTSVPLAGATAIAPTALTSDNASTLYYAETDATNNSAVHRFDVVSGTDVVYTTSGLDAAGVTSNIISAGALALDTVGNLLTGDDSSAAGTSFTGRLWTVATDTPLQPPFAQPAPSAPDLAPGSDAGRSSSDNITNVTAPVLTGAATPGATVRIFQAGAAVGTGSTDLSGVYRVTAAGLGHGKHVLTAQATRGVRTSAFSAPLGITVDTRKPAVRFIARPKAIAFDHSPTFRWATERTALSACSLKPIAAAPVFVACRPGLTARTLVDGGYRFLVQATDVAGNTSTALRADFQLRSAHPRPGPPRVADRFPVAGATAVDQAINVDVRFTEPVKHVGASTVTLTDTRGRRVRTRMSFDVRGAVVNLDPVRALARDHTYVVTVRRGITDNGGAHLRQSSWRFTTGPRPLVGRVRPAAGATGVTRTASITVLFNETVRGVSSRTLALVDATAHRRVRASVRAAGRHIAVIDPTARLAGGHRFVVTATTGVRDAAGNHLVARSWAFTTRR